MGATSFVPVISIHGIFTAPNAFAALPALGELGLNAIAAVMRASVNCCPLIGNVSPLTASVVIAPNEWPDIPTFFKFIRPASG